MSGYLVMVVGMFLLMGPVVLGSEEPSHRPQQTSAPSCPATYNSLRPCIPYLTANDRRPTEQCCSGVKQLQPYSKHKSDRVAICQCLKSLATLAPGVDLSVASKLPNKCKVNVKLPKLSLNFDCSKA